MELIDKLQNEILMLNQKLDLLLKMQSFESPKSFNNWFIEWYETYKRPKYVQKTAKDNWNLARKHILGVIPDVKLHLITSIDIEKCLNLIKGSRTRKTAYHLINGCFVKAYKLKYLKENVMVNVESVKHKFHKGNSLTKDDIKHFFKVVKNKEYYVIFRLYILTGCRVSELPTIKIEDIDLKSRLIRVRGTKTEGSDRFVPIFKETEEIIKQIPKGQIYLINKKTDAIKLYFKRLKYKYKFNFQLKSFRHTFATSCLQSGISIKTVQKWLGHSRITTTADIYSHILTEFEQKEIDKFKI